MRTLRSGKSLPDSALIRRQGSTSAVAYLKSSNQMKPTPEGESSQKKDPGCLEVAGRKSIPLNEEEPKTATKEPVSEEVSKPKLNDALVTTAVEPAGIAEATALGVQLKSPVFEIKLPRGRPRKSVAAEPKAEAAIQGGVVESENPIVEMKSPTRGRPRKSVAVEPTASEATVQGVESASPLVEMEAPTRGRPRKLIAEPIAEALVQGLAAEPEGPLVEMKAPTRGRPRKLTEAEPIVEATEQGMEPESPIIEMKSPTRGRPRKFIAAPKTAEDEEKMELDSPHIEIKLPTRGRPRKLTEAEPKAETAEDLELESPLVEVKSPTRGRPRKLNESEPKTEVAEEDEVEPESSLAEIKLPTRGRPKKSDANKKIEPKVEVPPTPPTDRLAKTEICQVCGMGFTRKATLLRHSKIHEEEAPEPEPTPRRRSAAPKIVKSQSPMSQICCDVCGLTFTRKAHLDRHALLHSDERPFPCDLCDQKFTRKDHMLSHRIKHNGEPLLTCTDCGMNFASKKSLDDHVKEEHLVSDQQADTFTCETCGKHFLQKRYLQAHKKLHTRDSGEFESFEHSEIEYQSAGKPSSTNKPEHSDVQYQSAKQASRAKLEQSLGSRAPRFFGNGSAPKSKKPLVFLNRVVKLSADLALQSLKGCDTDVEICLQDAEDGEEGVNEDLEEMDYDYETMVKQYPVEEGHDIQEGDENSDDAYTYSSTHPQQLECSVCGKAFSDRSTLRKHYRVHKKKFICRFCGLRLASAGSLMRHNLIHTGKKEFGCNLCGRKFSRKDTLAVHLSAHDKSTTRMNMPRPYLCRFCGASYTMKYNLIRHLKMCHSSSLKLVKAQMRDDQHTANENGATSSSAQGKEDMVISLMPNFESLPQRYEEDEVDINRISKRKIKCEPEDYEEAAMSQWTSFENEEDLNWDEDEPEEADDSTNQEPDGDGKYACNHCGKTFKNSKSLNTHKWYHSREKQFICHICNRGFKYSTDLNRHLNTHSFSKSKQQQPSMNFQSGSLANLAPKAQRVQSRQVNLQLQQQRAINNALEMRPFGCKLCPQRFNHRSNLSRHVRLLHNSTAARKRIPNSVNLQNYLKKLQVKRPGPVQVSKVIQRQQQQQQAKAVKEADESWKSWDGMNLPDASMGNSKFGDQDMNNSGMKDFSFSIDLSSSRPFSCNVCGKAFENKSNLWTHMRIHNKTFTCSYCGLKVATHGDLVLHVRTHTGERPFSCNLCEWRFSRKSALNKHTHKYHTPGKGKVLRPWKYREERMDGNNGNLKFKFIRSSPQKDDFQIQKMGTANNQTSTGNVTKKSLPGMIPMKHLPRLAPAPVPKSDMKILKSVLQDTGTLQRGMRLSEPGPSSKPPHLQKSPAIMSSRGKPLAIMSSSGKPAKFVGGKPPGRTNVLFLCRKCKQLITGKANYIEHMKSHQTGVQDGESQKIELKINRNFEEIAAKPFSCDECGQRFGQKAHLTRHQLSHQQSEVARCNICGKVCSSLGFLSRHYQYVHPDTHNLAEQARFRVPELDLQNSQQLDWAVPEVVMDDVEEDDKEPSNSKLHKRDRPAHTASTKDDKIELEINDVEPSSNESLSPSRVGPDGTEFPTPCERCGKEFSSKKARSDHVWYCKREKIHRCPVPDCNKEFKLKHDVVRHLKRHTNDKRFSCNVCQGRFFHKQDLNRHLRSVHKIILTDCPFPCDFCDMEYVTEEKLNHHMKITHGVDGADIASDLQDDNQDGESGGQGLVRSRSSMEDEYEDYLIENDMENEEFEEGQEQDEMDPSSFLEQSMGETSTDPDQHESHECELCFKVFSTRQKYMYHKYYHEREAKYSCKDCEEKFKLRSHLERHIRTYHNDLKPVGKILHCSQCPRKFTREYDLNTHINKIHSASTPPPHPLSILKTTLVMGDEEGDTPIPSNSATVSKVNRRNSTPTATGSKNPSVPVETPNSKFQNYDESSMEYEEEGQMSQEDQDLDPTGEPWQVSHFKCGTCGKMFNDKKAVDAHRYYHNREEKYACASCGARFKQNSDLQRHNRIHHNSANPKSSIHCPHCYRSFTDDRYMRMHIRRYHSEESQQGSIESLSPEGTPSGTVSGPQSRRDKSAPSIKKEPMDLDEGNSPGKTGVWNEGDNLVDLTIVENQDEEENSFVIDNWGRGGVAARDSKSYDQRDEDSGTDEDAMEELEYKNYKEVSLNEASSSSKAQSCSVTCGSCGAGLEDTNAIKGHVCNPKGTVTRRSDTSVVDCKICGAKFARSNELILHSRIHTGVKPFICSECGQNFVQRNDLNAHMQSEHNQSMRVFDCQFCPKRFFVRKSLDSHRRRHHGNIIQFFKCRQCGRQFTSQRFLEAHSRSCGSAESQS